MIMDNSLYFDYAAATPVDPYVLESMSAYFSERFYNPSATYMAARAVRKDIEAARAKVARELGARPAEIIFTAGGTEANNLAIQGIMSQYPTANLVLSPIEHDSVYEPAVVYKHKIAPVQPNGVVQSEGLTGLIDQDTVLVSVMYANNEIGTIQPIRKLAQQITQIRRQRIRDGNKLPLLFHTDACQAPLYLDINTARLGIDLMTLNGGKMHGPKQSGLLYVRAGVSLDPLLRGGGQEHGLRSGTENVANCIGLATALELAGSRRVEASRRLAEQQSKFRKQLAFELPNITWNGSLQQRLPNNIHITIPDTDNERVMMQLDEAGIIVAVGSACSASAQKPSRVLESIGLSDVGARASLRITTGRFTDDAAIQRLFHEIKRILL